MDNVIELKEEETVSTKEMVLGFLGWRSFSQGFYAHCQTDHSPWHPQGYIYPLETTPQSSWKIVLDLDELFENANVIFIDASYPQLSLFLPRMRLLVSDSHLLIFLGATFSFKRIAQAINEHKVIRCLASPVHRFRDISIVFAVSPLVTPREAQKLHRLFAGLPVVLQVDSEQQLDALQGLISTGPAIGYTLIDALADGVLKMQVPRKTGLLLAAHALFGAARTFLETEIHPGVLRDHSIQEKGIPLSGLMALEKEGLRGMMIQAIEVAAVEARKNSQLDQ